MIQAHEGRSWMRRHAEAGHFASVAQVSADAVGYSIDVTIRSPLVGPATRHRGRHYDSREHAFFVADVLARYRLSGHHRCTGECMGWTECAFPDSARRAGQVARRRAATG